MASEKKRKNQNRRYFHEVSSIIGRWSAEVCNLTLDSPRCWARFLVLYFSTHHLISWHSLPPQVEPSQDVPCPAQGPCSSEEGLSHPSNPGARLSNFQTRNSKHHLESPVSTANNVIGYFLSTLCFKILYECRPERKEMRLNA